MNKRTLYSLFILILIIVSAISGCSSMFYWPTGYLYVHPKKVNLIFEEIRFDSLDETELIGWNFPSSKTPESFTIFFHGNAQNLTSHYLNLKWMPARNHSFFIFDYRGYGISGHTNKVYGKGERVLHPNQQGVHKDAVAALNKAYQLYKESKAKRFIVYGQSLGGTILMRALEDFKEKDKIDLIILDSTFRSYQEMAFDKLWSTWILRPLAPLSYLLISDEYSSRKFLNINTTKVLVIHGTEDDVVPFHFGELIFKQLINTKDKIFWKIPSGGHIDVFTDKHKKYRDQLDKLIKSI
jgi:uncharacterized protein